MAISLFTLLFPSLLSSQEIIRVDYKLPKGGEEKLRDTPMRLEKDLEFGRDVAEDEPILAMVGDIAVDTRGWIYVLEPRQFMVFVYDSDGTYIRQIGRRGEGPGEFLRPDAITTNGTTLYVAGQQGVSQFDSTGTFISRFDHRLHDASTRGLVVTGTGHVFISCFTIEDRLIIHKFSRKGELLMSFCDSYAASRGEDFRVEQVYAGGPIDLGPDGQICYSQRTPYEIRKFSIHGVLTTVVTRENDFMTEPEVVKIGTAMQFTMPTASYGFCVLSDGTMVNSILVSIKQIEDGLPPSFIDVFGPDGRLSGSIVIDPSSLLLARDSTDRLYFREYADAIAVVRYRLAR